MKPKIKNFNALIAQGERQNRIRTINILENALQKLDSTKIIQNLIRLNGQILEIGNMRWDIGKKKRIFIIGAGKCGNAMAKGIEDVLGTLITAGLVIVKNKEPDDELQCIELIEGGHPLPNENGVKGSLRILGLIDKAGPDDLFISLISGGSTALISCPVPKVSLEDEVHISDLLLKCGARILEINAIRRHISKTNGGRIAQKIEGKGAELINLVISDFVGDYWMVSPKTPVALVGTPVGLDKTTLKDALNVLSKYDLISKAPNSIVKYLKKNEPHHETPKSFHGRIHSFVIQGSADAPLAVQKAAEQEGLNAFILTTFLEGESREAGIFLANVAKEIKTHKRPFPTPCAVIAGGETTTRIQGLCGMGGPSQELALGFALEIAGQNGICIAALDTDGTDGPSSYAGALTDGTTAERASALGYDVYKHLECHDSLPLLKATGDLILTGNTGTNLCDVNLLVIE